LIKSPVQVTFQRVQMEFLFTFLDGIIYTAGSMRTVAVVPEHQKHSTIGGQMIAAPADLCRINYYRKASLYGTHMYSLCRRNMSSIMSN
jgi:hypothetical protein